MQLIALDQRSGFDCLHNALKQFEGLIITVYILHMHACIYIYIYIYIYMCQSPTSTYNISMHYEYVGQLYQCAHTNTQHIHSARKSLPACVLEYAYAYAL